MSDPFSMAGLITSLILPWICGTVCVYLLLRASGRWNSFMVLGHGYPVGIFITTLLIRAWDSVGLPLQFWEMAAVLIGISLAGLLFGYLQKSHQGSLPKNSTALKQWQKFTIFILLFAILYRHATLLQELVLRPLYPWDAWMNWAPKPIVWFNFKQLTSIISPADWLQQYNEATTLTTSYTLTSQKGWDYPITVPLIQLWGMLGANTSDQPMIYLPWIFIVLALGLAFFGHLRLSGSSILSATLVCYVLLNLPFINVHTVLSGYADIWMSTALGFAALALHQWDSLRRWQYAFLVLVYAAMCSQLKIPGVVLGGIIFIVLLVSLLRVGKRTLIGICTAFMAGLLYIFTVGFSYVTPQLELFYFNKNGINMPYVGKLNFEFHPINNVVFEALFTMQQWNLLWYLPLPAIFIYILKQQKRGPFISGILLTCLTLSFLIVSFYFTEFYLFAKSFTLINRAILYVVPLVIFALSTHFLSESDTTQS